MKITIDGVEYILDVEKAKSEGSLVAPKRYYPYTFYKYSGDLWILTKDSLNKFNLIGLTNRSTYNTWYSAKNSCYLTQEEWYQFITPERMGLVIPVDVDIVEIFK
jgi:hypothetical protein